MSVYYGAWYNLGGLGLNEPVKLRHEPWDDDLYWVAEGECKDDFCFESLGLVVKHNCITFASRNIDEVQAFINGVKAVGTLMNIPSLEQEDEDES